MKYRIISPEIHALIDYAISMLLIISPFVFGFYEGGAESIVPVIIGTAGIFITTVTNYKFSLFSLLTLEENLLIDIITGAFLCLSPLIFYFFGQVFWPHVIFGIIQILTSLTTKKITVCESINSFYKMNF